MDKKYFWLGFSFLALILIIAGLFAFGKSKQAPSATPAPRISLIENEISLTLDYGNDSISKYSQEFKEGLTVYDVLKSSLEKNNIPFETKQYDFGIFVKSINSYESTAEKAWIYFVNGNSGQVAADIQELSPGDSIEWRYVKPE